MIGKACIAGALALGLSLPVGGQTETLQAPERAASGWFGAHEVPQPPEHQRGEAIAAPVYFVEQAGIDGLCGGKDQVVACTVVGGGAMALPNPCQARFAGESYAALVCHEKGHTLGWSHG